MAVDVEFLNGNNVNNINNNFQRVKNALQEAVGRNGNLPNHMNADLDMNSNDILNVYSIDLQRILLDGEEFDPRQMRGWAPVFSAVEYNGTVVMMLIDYVGGQGIKPTEYIGWYVGSTGYVQDINQATGFGSSGVTDGDKGDIIVSDSGSKWRLTRGFKTVQDLIADETMGYPGSGAEITVSVGDIVTAQGFRYEVVASGATEFEIENAGGIRLKVSDGTTRIPFEAFGLVGDGSTDDRGQFIKAILRASKLRATLLGMVGKNYFIDGQTLIDGVEWLDIRGRGCTITVANVGTGLTSLNFANSFNFLTTTITAPAFVGDDHILLADATGLAVGDALYVRSNQVFNQQRPSESFVTNQFRVVDIAGDAIYLDRPIYDDFDIATYTVTVTASKCIEGNGISHVHFRGENSAQARGVQIQYGIGQVFKTCSVKGFGETGLVLGRGWGCGMDRCSDEGVSFNLGYAQYLNGVVDGFVTRARSKGARHGVEVGGESVDCVVSHCLVTDSLNYGLSSHYAARNTKWLFNETKNCNGGLVSRGPAGYSQGNILESTGENPMLSVGEAGNTDRIGLAGVGFKSLDDVLISDGTPLIGCAIVTTLQDAILRFKMKGAIAVGHAVSINGESCERVDLDLDLTETTTSGANDSSLNIAPQVQDKIDVVATVRQKNGYDGVRIIEPRTTDAGVSKVELRDCRLTDNRNRPFDVSGKLKLFICTGGFWVDNVSSNARSPALADIGSVLEGANSATIVRRDPL